MCGNIMKTVVPTARSTFPLRGLCFGGKKTYVYSHRYLDSVELDKLLILISKPLKYMGAVLVRGNQD
jgi:hypothetical protein